MIKYLLILLNLLPLVAGAQMHFDIQGTGRSFADGDSIFLSYKQGNKWLLDSTVVHKNRFEFKGSVSEIVRGYICRNNNPRTAEILFDAFDVYLQAGNIRLQSPDSLRNSIISGTPLNNDHAAMIKALKPVIIKRRAIREVQLLSPEEQQNLALMASIQQQLLDNDDETFAVQLQFINSHPDSYVSLLALARIAKVRKHIPAVEKQFAILNSQLKQLPEGQDILRRIAENKKIQVGANAVDFIQPDTAGKARRLSDFRGRYVLLDFWASWCGPCRMDNRQLVSIYEKYRDQNLTIISISIDVLRNKKNWLKAIHEDQLPWLQLSDLKEKNEAAALYGITGIPANVLIDPDGKVIARDLKVNQLKQKLAAIF